MRFALDGSWQRHGRVVVAGSPLRVFRLTAGGSDVAAALERGLPVDPSRLVFLDESGASTAMDRTHGRCASGKRLDGPVPHGHGKVTTLTAAVIFAGYTLLALVMSQKSEVDPGRAGE